MGPRCWPTTWGHLRPRTLVREACAPADQEFQSRSHATWFASVVFASMHHSSSCLDVRPSQRHLYPRGLKHRCCSLHHFLPLSFVVLPLPPLSRFGRASHHSVVPTMEIKCFIHAKLMFQAKEWYFQIRNAIRGSFVLDGCSTAMSRGNNGGP